MADLVLQDLVGRQADRVACTLGFEELVNRGIREGCVTPEIQMLHDAPVTRDHRLQQRAPAVGTMDVAQSQRAQRRSKSRRRALLSVSPVGSAIAAPVGY